MFYLKENPYKYILDGVKYFKNNTTQARGKGNARGEVLLYTSSGVFREGFHLIKKGCLSREGPKANHTDIQMKSVSGRQNNSQVQKPRGRSTLIQVERGAKMLA